MNFPLAVSLICTLTAKVVVLLKYQGFLEILDEKDIRREYEIVHRSTAMVMCLKGL